MTEIATRFTASPIRFVTGVSTLVEIFQDRGNDGLAGALLEALARLFARNVRIYAYPMRADALADRLAASSLTPWTGAADGTETDRRRPPAARAAVRPSLRVSHGHRLHRVPAAGRRRLSGGIAAEVQVQATGHWQAIERHLSRYPLYPDVATTHEGTQEALRHGLDQHHVIDTGVHATGPGGTEAIVLRDAWVQRPV
jgi:hypothetical protein